MHKIGEKKRERAQSRYRAELEDADKMSRSFTKLEGQYQLHQFHQEEAINRKLQEIRERSKPLDYTALRNFSTAYDSKKVQMQFELEERQQRERSKNKELLPILKSYKNIMERSSDNFRGEKAVKKKEEVKGKVGKMKGYGTYVKKHFLPPVTTKNDPLESNIVKPSDKKRERFGKMVVNTAEEKLEKYSLAVRTREMGINYLKELKDEIKKAESENRVIRTVKEEISEKVNYKNYLRELEPMKRHRDKENIQRADELYNAVQDPSKDRLKALVTDIDTQIIKTSKKTVEGYLETIKAKLDILNKLN